MLYTFHTSYKQQLIFIEIPTWKVYCLFHVYKILFRFILYTIIIDNVIKYILVGLLEYTVDVCILLTYNIIILFNIFQFNNRNSSYTGIIENGVIEIDKRNEVFDAPQQTGKRNKIIEIIFVIPIDI